jgi:outer membrane protein assembly factor BamB
VLWRSDAPIVGLSNGAPGDLVVGLERSLDGTSTRFLAVDAESGEQRWASPSIVLPDAALSGSPGWQSAPLPQAIVDDWAAYLAHDGKLSRHDPGSGDVQWEVPAAGYVARSAVGHVVVFTDAETLTARAAADGHQEWTVTLPAVQFLPSVVNNATTFFVGATPAPETTTAGTFTTSVQAPPPGPATLP